MSEPLKFPITAAQVASLPDTSDDVVETVKPERIERDDGDVSAAPAKPVHRWLPQGARNV